MKLKTFERIQLPYNVRTGIYIVKVSWWEKKAKKSGRNQMMKRSHLERGRKWVTQLSHLPKSRTTHIKPFLHAYAGVHLSYMTGYMAIFIPWNVTHAFRLQPFLFLTCIWLGLYFYMCTCQLYTLCVHYMLSMHIIFHTLNRHFVGYTCSAACQHKSLTNQSNGKNSRAFRHVDMVKPTC